jgi:hypothetical protein
VLTLKNLYCLSFSVPVKVAERSKACTVFARFKPGPWVGIPLRAWMFSVVYVCAFFCGCVQVEALRRADHPSEESYRLSLIKKLRKLNSMLQKRSKLPSVGATKKEKIPSLSRNDCRLKCILECT